MAYRSRIRGRGSFTAPTTRTGKQFIYDGRRVTINGSHFKLSWSGPEVVQELLTAIEDAFNNLSNDALQYMMSITPEDTGRLKNSVYALVTIEGTRIKISIGAGAPYAIYVELGTRFTAAQPYIRPTFDYVIQQLPQLLKAQAQSRGLS